MTLPQCEVFTPFVARIADRPGSNDYLIDACRPLDAERPRTGALLKNKKKYHVQTLSRETKSAAYGKLRKVQVLQHGILHGQGGFGIVFVVARVLRIQGKDKKGEEMSVKKAIRAEFPLVCAAISPDFTQRRHFHERSA